MGFFSSIKKTFKKVLNVAKKALPIVLAAGAVVFTAGAALGLAPLGIAGGWGGAMSALTGSMGLTGTLGSVVTGALTNAGYGAVLGGVTSAVTGGDVMKGMGLGAAGGAITGGIGSAIQGGAVDPLSGLWEKGAATASPNLTTQSLERVATDGPATQGLGAGSKGGMVATSATAPQPATGVATAPGAVAPAAPSTATGANTGGFLGAGGWLERNGALAGNALSGLGQGLMAGMEEDDGEAAMEMAEWQQGNYTRPAYGQATATEGGRPTPSGRWPGRAGTSATTKPPRWRWDSERGEMVRG